MKFPRIGSTKTAGMFRTLDAASRVTLRVARFKPLENHWPGPCRECDTTANEFCAAADAGARTLADKL